MAWYKDWFGEDYLRVYPHRDAAEAKLQVDFVARILGFQPKQKILDLGCGNGRHANELARLGYDVTCLDLSPELLSVARRESSSEPCCMRFVRADMRNIPFATAFDSVVSFFTTFGYFENDEENLKTLHSLAGALKPQGTFLQDYVNKSYVVENLVPSDSRRENGFEIIQERFYNRADERIEKKITLKENSQVREYFESVRLYTSDEMKNLLAKTDLKLEKMYGDFDGSPFSAASPRLILIGRKEKHN